MIHAVTTCVGETYVELFARTVEAWLDEGVRLAVVTDPPTCDLLFDAIPRSLSRRLYIKTTSAFTEDGSFFNKGKALNKGLAMASPDEWRLAFDCDILPVGDWAQIAMEHADRESLNSANRFNAEGLAIDPLPLTGKGYFQLWHPSANAPDPPFREDFTHAGHYDTAFAKHFPRVRALPLFLTHLGQRSRYWFGPDTTPAQMQGVQQAIAIGKHYCPKRQPLESHNPTTTPTASPQAIQPMPTAQQSDH